MHLWITVKDSILSWHDNFMGLFCAVNLRLLFHENSPKQKRLSCFFLFFFLKILLYSYSTSSVVLKYYTQTDHWTHLFTYSFVLPRQSRWSGETVYLWGNTSDLLLTDTRLPFSRVKHWFVVSHPHAPPFSLRPSITCLYSSNCLFIPLTSFSILEPEQVEPPALRDSDVPVILPNRWGCWQSHPHPASLKFGASSNLRCWI